MRDADNNDNNCKECAFGAECNIVYKGKCPYFYKKLNS